MMWPLGRSRKQQRLKAIVSDLTGRFASLISVFEKDMRGQNHAAGMLSHISSAVMPGPAYAKAPARLRTPRPAEALA
jgi:hypothetical protein